MDICENCCEAIGCDQIKYDCPLMDFKGRLYKFNNAKGEEFLSQFKSVDNARDFAYRTGLCFLGRVWKKVKSMYKPYQIIVSSHVNFNTYYIVSSYDTLEEAQEHYNSDLEQFYKEHRKFWLSECYGYDAIIRDKEIISKIAWFLTI